MNDTSRSDKLKNTFDQEQYQRRVASNKKMRDENMADQIIIQRLLPFLEFPLNWDGVLIGLEDVLSLLPFVKEITEPFPDSFLYRSIIPKKSKKWHVGRIKYFVSHPEQSTPIAIDNDCRGGIISGYPIVIDGHHRLMAALVRKEKRIDAHYSGLISTLEYLTGIEDQSPIQI